MLSKIENNEAFINKLSDIVHENLGNDKFGVNELVHQSGLSYHALSHKLHEISGKTVIQFIKEVRLKCALEMLQNTDLTAAEVAYRTGFGSATYFSTSFTEFFGHPPGSVKKGEFTVNNDTINKDKNRSVSKRKFRKVILIAALLLIIILAAHFPVLNKDLFKKNNTGPGNPVTNELSLAVLPFMNLSDSAGNQYFVDGLAEDIRMRLASLEDIRVISWTSVEQYRNTDLSLPVIAKRLKVNYIVKGSVQKSGKFFRLWIELVEAESGMTIWSDAYNEEYTSDIFGFQNKVALNVASRIYPVINNMIDSNNLSNPTREIQAYDINLKGRALLRKWRYIKDTTLLDLASNLFDEALKLDPDYISALHGKAIIFREYEMLDSSLDYSKKILAIDKNYPYAISNIGVALIHQNKPESALTYFQKAIDNSPNNANLSWFYNGMGQALFWCRNDVIGSLPYFDKAKKFGGLSNPQIHYNISLPFYSIGDYENALEYQLNALRISSECEDLRRTMYILLSQQKYEVAINLIDSVGRITLCYPLCEMMRAYVCINQKQFSQAETYMENAIKNGFVPDIDDNVYIACLYMMTGRKEEAKSVINKIISVNDRWISRGLYFQTGIFNLRLAASYALLGDAAKTIQHLEKLETYGYTEIPISLKTFPGFDKIRNSPEFISILQKLESDRDSLRTVVKGMQQKGEIDL